MKIRIITSLLMMVMCGSTWASNPNLEQQPNQDSLLQEQTKQIIAEQKEREMLYLRELEHNAEKRAHIIQLSKLINKERAKLSKTDSKQKHSVSDDAMAERCMANIKAWQDEINSIRLTNPNTSIKFLSPSRHKNASSSTPESTAKSTAKAMSQALASQSANHERVDTIHDGNDILTYRYNNIGQVVECVYVDLYRYTYAYDDNGNRITEIRDNIATDEYGKKYWLPSSMKNMKYDSLGKYTMTEQYTYTNGEWVGSSKTENYYDADGYNCGTTQYLWDAEEQAWTISSHRKSTYNSHDNLTEYVNYSCRYGYSGEKQIYVYSDDDILLESASYSMSNNGEWVLTEKTVSELGDYGIAKTEYYTSSGNVGTTPALDKVIIYLYDEEGNRTGEETDVMQDGNLVGQSKSEYFASDKKNLEIEYEWNNDQWMVSYYNKTLFDDNNETIYQECYYASEGVKDYGSKTECTETQEGDNVKKVMTYYEIEQGEWHVVSKTETLLDTQNRELEKISYYLYESTLEPSSKTVNEYQDNKHFHYEYHWYGDQWRLFNAYGYHYTYDSNGKVIKETNMRLNGEWVETTNYTTYTYDNNGNLLALITYYNNTESYRKEITYDDNGNQLLLTEYNYSVPTQRSENQYDQNGNLTYSVSYYYVDNQWQKIGYEYTYQYNTAGERVATQSFNWYDGEISGGSYSHEETDDHNRTTIYEYYTNYSNGHWSSGRKDVSRYAYNGDEALTLLSESYTMQSDGTLKGISKVARSYDTQYNLLTEYKYDGWDNNTSDFILVSEKVYTRRDDGQVLTYDYATYANGVKTGKDKYTNTYDNNGHVTEYTKYNWNTTYKDWVNGYRTVYQWDDHDNVTLYETYYYSKNTWKKTLTTH